MKRAGTLVMMGVGALVILAFMGWIVWRGMLEIPANTARAWALAVTALLPATAWASWWFGHTEARGRLEGIDQAVDKVMGAATRAASLRVGTAQALRQSVKQEAVSPIVVLPDVEIMPRQLPPSGRVINL